MRRALFVAPSLEEASRSAVQAGFAEGPGAFRRGWAWWDGRAPDWAQAERIVLCGEWRRLDADLLWRLLADADYCGVEVEWACDERGGPLNGDGRSICRWEAVGGRVTTFHVADPADRPMDDRVMFLCGLSVTAKGSMGPGFEWEFVWALPKYACRACVYEERRRRGPAAAFKDLLRTARRATIAHRRLVRVAG